MTTQKRGTRALGAAVITLVACVVFTFTFIRSVAYSPEAEIPLPTSLTSAVSNQVRINDTDRFGAMGLPTRLIIPDLNIDAEVQKVGIAKSGNMTPPSHFSDVGWYKYGTVPGEVGSAVMAGHVDNALGLAGVFKYLGDLNTGQDIYVSTDKGEKLHFKVADIASYDYTFEVDKWIWYTPSKTNFTMV